MRGWGKRRNSRWSHADKERFVELDGADAAAMSSRVARSTLPAFSGSINARVHRTTRATYVPQKPYKRV